MPTYLYEALNSAGQSQKGTVEAGSSEEAVKQIKTQGYFPTAVREQKVKGGGPALAAPSGFVRRSGAQACRSTSARCGAST